MTLRRREQVERSIRVAFGFAQPGHGDEPAEPVLGGEGVVAQSLCRREVIAGGLQLVSFDEQLGETRVQVGDRRLAAAVGEALVGGDSQRVLVGTDSLRQPSQRQQHVGDDRGGAQCVGEVAREPEAGGRLAEGQHPGLEVTACRGGKPQHSSGGTPAEVVVGCGQIAGSLGVRLYALKVAAGLRHGRPIERHGHRQRSELVAVRRVVVAAGEQSLRGGEPRLDPVEVAAKNVRPRGEDAQHGHPLDGLVGQLAEPAQHLRVLPALAHPGNRRLDQTGRPRVVGCGERMAHRLVGGVVVLQPFAGPHVQCCLVLGTVREKT